MPVDVEIERIVWDDWNREHIARHAFAVHEVEEVVARRTIRKPTYKGRLLLIGTTATGRMVSVVIGPSPDQPRSFYVFTARPSSTPERRRYILETEDVQR